MSEIEFVNLGADDYDRAKKVLNKAKHPGFVGRELFYRCATTGVCCVAVLGGVDCGVAMVAKEKLQALSIVASVQGKGVGTALMRRLFERSDARHAIELVKLARGKAVGMRFYGRKRR